MEPTDQAPLPPKGGLRSWLRELSTPKRALVVAAVFALCGLLTLVATPRGDITAVSNARLVGGVILFGLTGLAAALVILRPMHRRPLRRSTAWIIALSALLVPVVFAVLPPAHRERVLHPESFADEGNFLVRALICLVFGTIVALPVIASAMLLNRRDRLGRSHALQVAFAGGAAGNLALLLHCPIVSHSHILAGHVTVPVCLGIALYFWARRRP